MVFGPLDSQAGGPACPEEGGWMGVGSSWPHLYACTVKLNKPQHTEDYKQLFFRRKWTVACRNHTSHRRHNANGMKGKGA